MLLRGKIRYFLLMEEPQRSGEVSMSPQPLDPLFKRPLDHGDGGEKAITAISGLKFKLIRFEQHLKKTSSVPSWGKKNPS